MPTASAVLSDVIYIARDISHGLEHIEKTVKSGQPVKMQKPGDIISKYYLRFNVVDKTGVLASIAGVLGKNNIGIESVIQKVQKQHFQVPVVIMTYAAKESDMNKSLKKINAMKAVKEKTVVYRVVD